MADKNAALGARFNAMNEDELRNLLREAMLRIRDLQNQIGQSQENQEQISELYDEIKELQAQVDKDKAVQKSCQQKLLEYANTIKKLNEAYNNAKGQLVAQSKVLKDYTNRHDQMREEAESILEQAKIRATVIEREAKKRAEEIEDEAEQKKTRAERRIRKAENELSEKLAQANRKADDIIASRLEAARKDIEDIETRREMSRRSAVRLNQNLIARYDTLSSDINTFIGNIGDMQTRIEDFNSDIEEDNFQNFDINDYVKAKKKPKTTRQSHPRKSYLQPYNKVAPDILDSILDDEDDYYAPTRPRKRQTQRNADQPVIAPVKQNVRTVQTDPIETYDDEFTYDDMDSLNDLSDLDMEPIYQPVQSAPTQQNGNQQNLSFTGSFAAIGSDASKANQNANNNDSWESLATDFDDDLNDFSGLDNLDDFGLDDMVDIPDMNATSQPAFQRPQVQRTKHSKGPSSWL